MHPTFHVANLGSFVIGELIGEFSCEQQSHGQFQGVHHSDGVFDPRFELARGLDDQVLDAQDIEYAFGLVAVVRNR